MQPPVAQAEGSSPETANGPRAALSCLEGSPPSIEILKARADFLAAARGRSKGQPGFHLQARRRADEGPIRVGFTCSKKVGNAVARNRAKRRLREIARLELPQLGRPGWDYVLIGRRDATATTPFDTLRTQLRRALKAVH